MKVNLEAKCVAAAEEREYEQIYFYAFPSWNFVLIMNLYCRCLNNSRRALTPCVRLRKLVSNYLHVILITSCAILDGVDICWKKKSNEMFEESYSCDILKYLFLVTE